MTFLYASCCLSGASESDARKAKPLSEGKGVSAEVRERERAAFRLRRRSNASTIAVSLAEGAWGRGGAPRRA
eukprot:scaffold260_cov274-Pinguiococcus_pyrenoidosus.AAC.7